MRPTQTTPSLRLYIRSYCHLCEHMLAAIHAAQQQHQLSFDLSVIDIDDDDELEARYAALIPILITDDARTIAMYHLDEHALIKALTEPVMPPQHDTP